MKSTVAIEGADLESLIARAEQGEEIVLTRGDKALVRLVAAEPVAEYPERDRTPGMFKGKVDIGPAFFEPLPPEELALWE